MRKIILLFLFPVIALSQTTYYVSNAGDDANNGTSTATSWATLFRIHNTAYVAGDSILLKRGDTWEGQIFDTLKGSAVSPIVIGAYGTGAKPILYGDLRGLTWTQVSGYPNIWKCYLGGYSVINTGYWQWVSGAWVQSSGTTYRSSNPLVWGAFYDSLGAGEFGVSSGRDTAYAHLWNDATYPATSDSIKIYRYANNITTSSHDYIIRDLDVRNYYMPILCNGDNATVRAVNTLNGHSSGIRMINTTNSFVDSCVVDSSGETGIYLVQAHKTLVRYNTVKNVLLTIDGGISTGIDLSAIGILGNYAWGRAQDTIGYNTVENNTYDNIYRAFSDWYFNLGDTVRNNTGKNGSAGGSPHGSSLVMTGNNWTGGASGLSGTNIGNLGSGNINYSNNTLDSVTAYGIWTSVNSGGGTITVKHNTVTTVGTARTYVDYKAITGLTADSNSFFGISGRFTRNSVSYYDIPTFYAATGFDEHSTLNSEAGATDIALFYHSNDTVNIKHSGDTIQVLVTDTDGIPVSGVDVTFARTTSPSGSVGQTITTGATTTDVSGLATTVLTLGSKAGNYVVTATSAGLTGSPVTITTNAYRSSNSLIKR